MNRGDRGSVLRSLILSVAAFGALLVLTQLMPGGSDRRGLPTAIIFAGIVIGSINALIAAGIVLIYRTTRIINFAQASIGAAGGVFTYNLVVDERTGWPFMPAFLAGIIVAGLVGVVLELAFVRRFFNAPRLVLTVVTIALIAGLGFAAGQINLLPIFTPPAERSLERDVGLLTPPLPFEDFQFQVGDLAVPYGFPHLLTIGMSIVALIALAAFFRFTKAGVAVRAAAENSDRATLLGINVKGLSTLVWGIAGLLSGVAVILTGIVGSFGGLSVAASGEQVAGAIIIALAAAVLAKMRSIPVAVAAAVGLEIVRQGVQFSFRDHASLFDTGVFLVILLGLLMQRRALARGEEQEISSWEATQELRPTPREMLQVQGVRIWRRVLIGIGVVTVLLFPWAMPTGPTNVAGFIALQGIALLSLVVLTGWAGQVSLGQWALVGIGSLIGGALTAKMGLSFWLAIPVAILVTGSLALLIGIPALRIRGLFLAITTFAMAVAVQTNLFNPRYFGFMIPDEVRRPTLLLLDFEDERSMYYLALSAFGLAVVVVTRLRRSRPGRIFIALRENETNLESFGVNPVRVRLSAFALSGALCGFAGVILAHHQRDIAATAFPAAASLTLFIFAIIGGIGSVTGAILGTGYLTLQQVAGQNPFLGLVVGPVAVLAILYIAPGGLAGIFYALRDGIYRIIAQRRRMIVPSLFADIDPEAAERHVAPLAEPLPNAGLSVLPPGKRYRTVSWLYGLRAPVDGKARRTADAAAFGAAAERAEIVEEGAPAIGAAAAITPAGVVEEASEIAGEGASTQTKGGRKK